jgi:hypothetical protein
MPMTPMTRITFLAAAAATVAIVVPGIATAAADDYSGQTYGDATAKLSDAGKKAVITSRSGDSLPQAKCVVTHSQSAPWLKGEAFTPVTNTVLLDLNCNATVATAMTPGNSAASPEGRKALKEAAAKKKKAPSSSNAERSSNAPRLKCRRAAAHGPCRSPVHAASVSP